MIACVDRVGAEEECHGAAVFGKSVMGLLPLEWLLVVIALAVGGFAFLAARKRTAKNTAPDTFQDMSIFDDEVASGNYEIDPISEAEVYLAYGNREQAVALLKKAAEDHPERQDIRDKIDQIGMVRTSFRRS